MVWGAGRLLLRVRRAVVPEIAGLLGPSALGRRESGRCLRGRGVDAEHVRGEPAAGDRGDHASPIAAMGREPVVAEPSHQFHPCRPRSFRSPTRGRPACRCSRSPATTGPRRGTPARPRPSGRPARPPRRRTRRRCPASRASGSEGSRRRGLIGGAAGSGFQDRRRSCGTGRSGRGAPRKSASQSARPARGLPAPIGEGPARCGGPSRPRAAARAGRRGRRRRCGLRTLARH